MFLWIMVLAIIAMSAYMLYHVAKARSKLREEKTELNNKYNALLSGSIQHVDGLQIPKGVFIKLYYGNDKITFIKDNQEISLDLSKIISMDIVSGNDIQSQTTGAIAGKLILGGLSGVVLGSLISTKIYFIISYKSNNKIKSIIFDNSGGELSGDKLDVFKVVKDFKSKYNSETEKIEL